MSGITVKFISKNPRGVTFAFALYAAACFCGSAAKAQNAFTMNISEKEMKLDHPEPTDMAWNKWLMWDLGYERMMDRNTPYIELQNAATSSSPITEFHLTIGDSRFNFVPDTGTSLVALGSTTPGFDLSSTSVSGAGKELVVTIGNGGLLPGHLVRFQIKLGVDPSFATSYAASFGASQPDYRTVLFDINADGGSTPINLYGPDPNLPAGASDNASAFVLFGDVKSSTQTLADATVDAEGQAVNGQYRNNALRPYSASDNVNLFQLEGHEVPEPGTIALAMLGFSSILFSRRGR
ncbi:MAG TPA: PEP-CTERM sorting domain-containing protein [Lacipirellulaceae bacterium]|jgi:hypothetical protein|nr:PEP-CTERM sorting domain-containing protein [Lacipirellulaceae bacterium]